MITKTEFLYPRSRYHGNISPSHLVFNANLQEFAQRVGYIANLQTGGKLSTEESYEHIRILWVQFEFACRQLKIPGTASATFHELED
jgi:hypothetical protein